MPTYRVYNLKLKVEVAQHLVNGESVISLHDKLGTRRGVLYRWQDVYRKKGATGLRLTGRPTGGGRRAAGWQYAGISVANCRVGT